MGNLPLSMQHSDHQVFRLMPGILCNRRFVHLLKVPLLPVACNQGIYAVREGLTILTILEH
jgi:hypothetical protein